jgi:hypothetical protein
MCSAKPDLHWKRVSWAPSIRAAIPCKAGLWKHVQAWRALACARQEVLLPMKCSQVSSVPLCDLHSVLSHTFSNIFQYLVGSTTSRAVLGGRHDCLRLNWQVADSVFALRNRNTYYHGDV